MACLVAIVVGEAKARAEDDLTRIRDALETAKEDRRRLEAKVARLTVERASLLLELEASKDEVSVDSCHSRLS